MNIELGEKERRVRVRVIVNCKNQNLVKFKVAWEQTRKKDILRI